ncbi:MAG: hypothetical protein ABIV28_06040 [Longimicrobiales bacterium]
MQARVRDTMRAFALRDAYNASFIRVAAISAFAGMAAAWLASTMHANHGMEAIIVRFDRTLAIMLALHAPFRAIERVNADASSDWMLQLTAGGAAKSLYVVVVPLCIAAGAFLLFCAGAVTFLGARTAFTHDAGVIRAGVRAVPLTLLMLVSSSAFGTAIACVIRGRSASRIAALMIAAPWVALAFNAASAASDTGTPPTLLVDVLGYLPPRLYLAFTLQHISQVLLYTGLMFVIALFAAGSRIGRRA